MSCRLFARYPLFQKLRLAAQPTEQSSWYNIIGTWKRRRAVGEDDMTVRICHLISCLDVGGAEMSLFRLLSAIDRNRFQSSVTSLIPPGRVGEQIRQSGFPVRSLSMKRGRVSPRALLTLTRLLRRDRPDVLMTWLYHSDLLGLVAGKMAGIPSIVWNLRAAGVDMSRYRKLSGWTLKICTKLSSLPNAVVANSTSAKMFHEHIGYRPRRWAVIRNGVNHEVFKPDAEARNSMRNELGLAPEALAIGLVARFDPMKDHETFMAAARAVAQANDSAVFVLAGKGMTKQNHSLAPILSESPFGSRVCLLGEREDVPRLMAALDVVCSSSLSESFPNTIAEAMACGLTCVATDVGDSASIIGDTGLVVAPGQPDALARGLLRVIEMDRSTRKMLGCAARERIIQNFSFRRSVDDYEAFFSRLIEK